MGDDVEVRGIRDAIVVRVEIDGGRSVKSCDAGLGLTPRTLLANASVVGDRTDFMEVAPAGFAAGPGLAGIGW